LESIGRSLVTSENLSVFSDINQATAYQEQAVDGPASGVSAGDDSALGSIVSK
jgi:hypothetical protein